jgi:RNA polymerase sigma-70 factor (ECF subfamily)
LLARVRRGDPDAFLAADTAHAGFVRALVGRFFTRAFEREEAIQEVWLLAHRMASTFDPERGTYTAWLRAVATNRCKEILRAKGRRPSADFTVDDDDLVTAEGPEEAARSARVQQAIQVFMRALDADEAQVFRFSLLEELTHEETAAATGLSPRRCKYLRMKLLLRASSDPSLQAALKEAVEP